MLSGYATILQGVSNIFENLDKTPEAFKFNKIQMENGSWNIKGPVKKWNDFQKKAIQWLIDRHGKENLVHYTVHFDEKTPHIHAYCTPIIKKEVKWRNQKGSGGKIKNSLTARDFNGTKQMLRDMQDSFALSMSSLGLERGKRGSNAKHEHIQKYYTRVNEAHKFNKEITEFKPKPINIDIERPSRIGNLDDYTAKTEEMVNNAISEAQTDAAKQVTEQFEGEIERVLESKAIESRLRGEISSLANDVSEKAKELTTERLKASKASERLIDSGKKLANWKKVTEAALKGDLKAKQQILNQLYPNNQRDR